MADIDKSLPNEVRKTIEIEGPEKEVEITEEIEESIPTGENIRSSSFNVKSKLHGLQNV